MYAKNGRIRLMSNAYTIFGGNEKEKYQLSPSHSHS